MNPHCLGPRPIRGLGSAGQNPAMPSDNLPSATNTDPGSHLQPGHGLPRQDRTYDRGYDTHTTLDLPSGHLAASPREARLGWSPPTTGISALDAPLPSSFNSQEASNIAKFGPSGTSVPSRFGWDPLTSNSPTTSTVGGQAFGNLDSVAMGPTYNRDNAQRDYATSPPTSAAAEVMPRRILHSQRHSRPHDLSASLPAHARLDDAYGSAIHDDDETHEEDLVPSTLDDLLTPEEKSRRFSRSEQDHQSAVSVSRRPSHSSRGSPPESKVGSPIHSSPSRFGAFFANQARAKRESHEAQTHSTGGAFSHVGSPLRNSHISGDDFGDVMSRMDQDLGRSPPSAVNQPFSAGSDGKTNYVSSLSEQLKSTRIGPAPNNKKQDIPVPTRQPGSRVVSSNGSVVSRERIDEEPLFSMDDESEPRSSKEADRSENVSSANNSDLGARNAQETAKNVGQRRFADAVPHKNGRSTPEVS